MSETEKQFLADLIVGLSNPELLERIPQTDEEIRECKFICSTLAQTINGGKVIPITWESGQGWYWSFVPGQEKIVGDEKDLREKGLWYAAGAMVHEASHNRISRPGVFTNDEWQQRGWGIGYNWVEDCRIEFDPDNVVREGKNLVRGHLIDDMKPGGGLDFNADSVDSPIGGVKQKIGYIPKHMAFGAAMRQYFYYKVYTDDFTDPAKEQQFFDKLHDYDPTIAAAFEKIRENLEEYYHLAPQMFADENEIDAKATESGEIYRDKIWPEYQRLVVEAYDEHALKKFIDDLMDGAQYPGQGGGGTTIIIDFDSLPEEVKKEIEKAIDDQQKAQQGGGQPQQGGGEGGGQAEKRDGEGSDGQQPSGGSSGDGGSGENTDEEPQSGTGSSGASESNQSGSGQPQANGEGQSSAGASQPGEQPPQNGEPSGSNGSSQDGEGQSQTNPTEHENSDSGSGSTDTASEQTTPSISKPVSKPSVPFDKLSPEAKQKIKDEFNKVNQGDQDKIKDDAEKEMDEVEQSVSEQIQGHTDREGVTRPVKPKPSMPEQGGKEGGDQGGEQDGEQGEESGDQGGEQGGEQDREDKPADEPNDKEQQPPQPQPPSPQKPPVVTLSPEERRQLDEYRQELNDMVREESSDFTTIELKPHIKTLIETILFSLDYVLNPNRDPARIYDYSAQYLDIDLAIAYDLGVGDGRNMYDEITPETRNYRFILLVDLSSSMSIHIQKVFELIVALTSVLKHLAIPFELLGFSDYAPKAVSTYYPLVSEEGFYGAKLTEAEKEKISGIRHATGGNTPTSRALITLGNHLLDIKSKDLEPTTDFVLVITDGQPTDRLDGFYSAEESAKHVVDTIREECQSRNLEAALIGLGIGPNTQFVDNLFGKLPLELQVKIAVALNWHQNGVAITNPNMISCSFESAEVLGKVFGILIEYILENPSEF